MLQSATGSCRHVPLAKRLVARMNVPPRTISSPGAKKGGMAYSIAEICYAWLTTFFLSYVAALELRVEKLERRLAYARSRKASVAQHESDLPAVPENEPPRKDSLANIRAAIHRKAERKRENSDVNSLMADFGFL